MDAVFERVSRDRIYAITGIQFLPINTIYQLYAACRATPRLVDAARALVTIPDLLNYWLTGALTVRVHRGDDHAVHRRANADVGHADAGRDRAADAAAAAARRAGHDHRRAAGERLGRRCAARRWSRPPATIRRRRSPSVTTSGNTAFLSSGTWSLLGTELRRADHHLESARAQLHQRGRRLRHDPAAEEHRRPVAAAVLPAALGITRAWICRYETLVTGADDERLAFRSLIDPDYPPFLNPTNMPATIAEYCRMTGQPEPDDADGLCAHDSREPGVQVPSGPRIARGAHRPPLRRDSHRRRRIAQPSAEAVDRGRHRPRP